MRRVTIQPGNLTNVQFSIPNVHPKGRGTLDSEPMHLSPRMRIEQWELSIRQIPQQAAEQLRRAFSVPFVSLWCNCCGLVCISYDKHVGLYGPDSQTKAKSEVTEQGRC